MNTSLSKSYQYFYVKLLADRQTNRLTAGMLRCRDLRGLETTFWSRPRSLKVLVFVSYALISRSQIDLVFLKCNDF